MPDLQRQRSSNHIPRPAIHRLLHLIPSAVYEPVFRVLIEYRHDDEVYEPEERFYDLEDQKG